MDSSDKIFLPSAAELYGSATYQPDPPAEERTDADGPAEIWWAREPAHTYLPPWCRQTGYYPPPMWPGCGGGDGRV